MTQAIKVDLRREFKGLYGPPAGRPVLVDVPELSFLMVDGVGDPNVSQDYRDAVQALFAISYAVKFAVKRSAGGIDYRWNASARVAPPSCCTLAPIALRGRPSRGCTPSSPSRDSAGAASITRSI
jgi:hypothetical protein